MSRKNFPQPLSPPPPRSELRGAGRLAEEGVKGTERSPPRLPSARRAWDSAAKSPCSSTDRRARGTEDPSDNTRKVPSPEPGT